jgi:hypothetical protein
LWTEEVRFANPNNRDNHPAKQRNFDDAQELPHDVVDAFELSNSHIRTLNPSVERLNRPSPLPVDLQNLIPGKY